MISQTDLVAELQRRGYRVTQRQVRDWRRKGLLPRLKRRSLGRGRGVERYWDHDEIVPRAMTICDLLARKRRVKFALLGLWFAGYDVKLKTVKTIWLESLSDTKKEWLGNALSQEQCEDAIYNLTTALARSKSGQAWAGEHNSGWDRLGPLLHEILNALFSPAPEPAIDNNLADTARTIFFQGIQATTESQLIDRDDLESSLRWVGENLSIGAWEAKILGASNEELSLAHNRWCSALEIVHRLASLHCGGAVPDELAQIGRQAAAQLGGFGIFGLLKWPDS